METVSVVTTVLLSLKVAVLATSLSIIPGFAVAYLMREYCFRWKLLFEIMINLPLALPPISIGLILLYILNPGHLVGKVIVEIFGPILFTWKAAVIASAVVGFPLLVRAIRINLDHIDPLLINTAKSLGAKRKDIIFSIILPLTAPGILAGALMMFIRSIGEFGATIMICGNLPGRTQTLSLAIYESAGIPNNELRAYLLSLVALLLAIVVLVIYDKIMSGVIKRGE